MFNAAEQNSGAGEVQNIDWQELLNEATDAECVASICNEFLRTWTSGDIAGIPAGCHPPATIAVEQVGPYAIKLIAEIGVGNRTTAPLLYAMSTFFTKAALRLAELSAPRARPAPSSRHTSGTSTA